jgi:ABC-type sugar transport system substrate-binding protein
MTRVGFIPCLPPGLHPGMDALAHGIAHELESDHASLCVFPADLRGGRDAIASAQSRALYGALTHGVEAIILFVLDMREPEAAVATALSRAIPVISIHSPTYPVSAALIVPNYHQGVLLAQALARAIPAAAQRPRVAILGGPEILDDVELVRGAVFGVTGSGLELVNDPFAPEYRNLDDVRGAGRRAAERVLDDHLPFDGWIVFNDETLVDALDALDARHLGGRLPTVSRNGSPHAIAALRRGRTSATLDYQLPELGALAGRTALAAVRKQLPHGSLVSAPIGELFTAENADRYRPWSERAPQRPLDVEFDANLALPASELLARLLR